MLGAFSTTNHTNINKRSPYKLRSAKFKQRRDNIISLFKTKRAQAVARPVKKAPNRPVYHDKQAAVATSPASKPAAS